MKIKGRKHRLKEKKKLRRYIESMGIFLPKNPTDEPYESPTKYFSLSEQFQSLQLENKYHSLPPFEKFHASTIFLVEGK
jgi:hypothetical protein